VHPEVFVPRSKTLACAAILLFGMACRSRVDVAAEARALLETDIAWARVSAAGQNADSILAYWTDDARVAMPEQPLVEGKAALRQMVASSLATPGFRITWTPEAAVVSRSADLGYTVGTNEITGPGPTGKATTVAGRYLTVWRKDSGGRWRCVADYASPAPPAPPPRT
jgi:ketosteroid isomerase-like protein